MPVEEHRNSIVAVDSYYLTMRWIVMAVIPPCLHRIHQEDILSRWGERPLSLAGQLHRVVAFVLPVDSLLLHMDLVQPVTLELEYYNFLVWMFLLWTMFLLTDLIQYDLRNWLRGVFVMD